jgi:bacillithiol biosynthesis cysteine-adding enzyme BshC
MLQTIDTFSFSKLPSIPHLVQDFLNEKLDNKVNWTPENIENTITEKLQHFSKETRKTVHQVLLQQHKDLPLAPLQQENLDAFALTNTLTITTGHQLNLFSGPVFFVYKILQTIKTAHECNEKYPDYHFVPVFWMATEDHDFQEINHFNSDQKKYQFQGNEGGAVGRIQIENIYFIQEFAKDFIGTPFGEELINIMKKSYVLGTTLAHATRILVQQLFSEYGLLILDGDDSQLKKTVAPLFRDELIHEELSTLTKAKVDFLKETYGKVQVNPRAINLFYLNEQRNRIVFENNTYKVLNTTIEFSPEEIWRELDLYPERFSPNALLRPAYQESILPNLAYIGGNAEIAYWLELSDYFKFKKIVFPILVPRNSMVFISQKIKLKIEKMNLKVSDFFDDKKLVIAQKLQTNTHLFQLLEQKENELIDQFSQLKQMAEQTDVSFVNLVSAEEKRQLNSFGRMRKRLLKAEKVKHEEWLQRLDALWLQIHPKGQWQERCHNFSVYYKDYGKEWLRFCYENMIVEKSELIVVAHSF